MVKQKAQLSLGKADRI